MQPIIELIKGKAVVILLSGGMDSVTLLHWACKEGKATVYGLSVKYGQKHQRELDMARYQIQQLGPSIAEWQQIDLTGFIGLVKATSTLVEGGQHTPALSEIKEEDRIQPPTYVPNRNMVLLSLAAAMAEARQCPYVLYGAQAQDEYGYWDCTPLFVARMNSIFNLNRRFSVKILAPFIEWEKSQILKLGLQLGVDYRHTWSCYRGGDSPCKVCPTCIERMKAFQKVGISDPLLTEIKRQSLDQSVF